ncbi:Fc.00g107360.m01.CDS01 [Cosmosporella sp. VM-42]
MCDVSIWVALPFRRQFIADSPFPEPNDSLCLFPEAVRVFIDAALVGLEGIPKALNEGFKETWKDRAQAAANIFTFIDPCAATPWAIYQTRWDIRTCRLQKVEDDLRQFKIDVNTFLRKVESDVGKDLVKNKTDVDKDLVDVQTKAALISRRFRQPSTLISRKSIRDHVEKENHKRDLEHQANINKATTKTDQSLATQKAEVEAHMNGVEARMETAIQKAIEVAVDSTVQIIEQRSSTKIQAMTGNHANDVKRLENQVKALDNRYTYSAMRPLVVPEFAINAPRLHTLLDTLANSQQ